MYNNEISEINLEKLIDSLIIDISDYNVASVISSILKNKYKYIGNNKWEYYDNKQESWINDIKNKKFISDINTNITNLVLNRIYYYEKLKKININNIDLYNSYDISNKKLLNIISKFHNKKYLNSIIREVKPFFN
tara:strand:+ start:782 stop:1186 length:405 start_codon:yes stop_codon:yes gene_type:complete